MWSVCRKNWWTNFWFSFSLSNAHPLNNTAKCRRHSYYWPYVLLCMEWILLSYIFFLNIGSIQTYFSSWSAFGINRNFFCMFILDIDAHEHTLVGAKRKQTDERTGLESFSRLFFDVWKYLHKHFNNFIALKSLHCYCFVNLVFLSGFLSVPALIWHIFLYPV